MIDTGIHHVALSHGELTDAIRDLNLCPPHGEPCELPVKHCLIDAELGN